MDEDEYEAHQLELEVEALNPLEPYSGQPAIEGERHEGNDCDWCHRPGGLEIAGRMVWVCPVCLPEFESEERDAVEDMVGGEES